jgi:dihydrolipoamide dehydrogenase
MAREPSRGAAVADEYDVVVLGGGPGGYAAALYGASAGLRIALVEERRVGGTCLHEGCVPAKELLQTAEVLRTIRHAGEFGIGVDDPILDLKTGQARKQQVIDKLTRGLEGLLKQRGVAMVQGWGTVVDGPGRRVRVDDGTELVGRALILATGSYPRTLPGLDYDGVRVLSSEHVLVAESAPERALVVGGGAIGCEFASMLVDFGTDVTIVEMMPRLLPGADEQVADFLGRTFKRRGINVLTDSRCTSIEGAATLDVVVEGPSGVTNLTVDQVIVSIGRGPRTAGMGFEEAGVELTSSGHVRVDGRMETTVPGVYAVGDIVDTPQLAHVAFSEAIVAIKAILGEDVAPIEYDKVPWGIYCYPEVAWAGLTEEEARARGHEVVKSVHRFGGNSRALIVGEADGFVKIVADAAGTILGVHVVGPWATELVAEGYLAVNWEATAEDVGRLVHAHPTLSELFAESALALTGRALH